MKYLIGLLFISSLMACSSAPEMPGMDRGDSERAKQRADEAYEDLDRNTSRY